MIEGTFEKEDLKILKQARSLIRKIQQEAAEYPAMDNNHYAELLKTSIDYITIALKLDKIDKS